MAERKKRVTTMCPRERAFRAQMEAEPACCADLSEEPPAERRNGKKRRVTKTSERERAFREQQSPASPDLAMDQIAALREQASPYRGFDPWSESTPTRPRITDVTPEPGKRAPTHAYLASSAVMRALDQIELLETELIQVDLVNFQEARRKIIMDAANLQTPCCDSSGDAAGGGLGIPESKGLVSPIRNEDDIDPDNPPLCACDGSTSNGSFAF